MTPLPFVGGGDFNRNPRDWLSSAAARNRGQRRARDTARDEPTLSEMMHEAVLAAYGRAIHV